MHREEFERLALAELDAVFRFARFLTRDAERAEDLVQEVYARAFRPESIHGFSARGGGMRAWLMTIARTSFYSRGERERIGERAVARIATERASRGDAETLAAGEAAGIDWSLASSRLHEALAGMSEELREVLWFWAVEGLKYREIAEALAIPIGTVMSRLHRARAFASRVLAADERLAPQLASAGLALGQHRSGEREREGEGTR